MSIKIDQDVKTDLTKVAGEMQAELGQDVTPSDAIKNLIIFYRKHKEA